jgi:hypothetical protein
MTLHQEDKQRMVKDGEVLFIIRRTDLNRAIREVQANCKGFPDIKTVNLLVSEFAITVRSVGMESEYPVNGIQPGTFQMPITVLKRIASMRDTKELALHVQEGSVDSGSSTVRHPEIHLSSIPDLRVSVPIDAPLFDLLVIGRLLDAAELEKQGLTQRIAKARAQLHRDVGIASSCLSRYSISRHDLEALLEQVMKKAEPTIRAAIYA